MFVDCDHDALYNGVAYNDGVPREPWPNQHNEVNS